MSCALSIIAGLAVGAALMFGFLFAWAVHEWSGD